MFIPIGDNIERRTFPLVTVLVIIANVLVFAYQLRTSYDAMKASQPARKSALSSASPPSGAVSADTVQAAPWRVNPKDDDFEFDYENTWNPDNTPWLNEKDNPW